MKPNFERLITALFLEDEPDRVPFYDLLADPEVIEAITGEHLIAGSFISSIHDAKSALKGDQKVIRAIKHDIRVQVKFYSKLGYDYIPLSIPTPFPRTNLLLADDTAPLRRPKRAWQDEYKGMIETREDFDKYPWPDLTDIQEVFLFLYEIARRELPNGMMIIPLTPGGVLENVMWLMGTVPFAKALYKDPVLIRNMFEKVGKVISFYCAICAECDMVGAMTMGDDMGYKSGPMLSPETLRKYVFPWHKRCVENVHKHGKPFILHSCGNIKILMEDLINYVGIDAKHSFEDVAYPVTEYKELYGDRIAILGGVDMDKLSRMPKDQFIAYVKDIIRKCAPGGGYALGCGNSVANYIKLENYLLMLEIGKKYGRYPIRSL
ncbi:MAG: uroporphyrinogen-III decarboxylase-like protein [Thermoprotei archaeon]|nr:MAG: uroporphyrinogen-III decarboxylase-like protein [Thermoprotei archaeon]